MSITNTNLMQIQTSVLTSDENQKAALLAKSIDLNNENAITNFGIDTQKKLGDHSAKILSEVKTKDTDEIGVLLGGVLEQVQSYDISQSTFEKMMSNIPIIGKFYQMGNKIISQHKTVESNLNDIVERLDKSRVSLSNDNENLKSLYNQTLQFVRENKINVEALKMKMLELNGQIESIRLELAVTPDQIKEQELGRLTNMLSRIEKKIHNMQILDAAAYQTIPTIVMMGDNNQQLMTDIETVIMNTIPIWKTTIANALYLEKQKRVVDMQNAIYDTTNSMMVKNSKTIKENSIKVAKHMERDIIDIETFKQINKDLVETIQAVAKIKEDGKLNRDKSSVELANVTRDMSEAIKMLNVVNEKSNSVIIDKTNIISLTN